MQLQMEVTDLNECDFLETRFKEYETEEDFLKDGGFDDCKKVKGLIIQFSGRDGPIYKYSPFLAESDVVAKWLSACLDNNETMTWIRNIYWALEEYSCILVPRNKKWFESIVPQFEKIWKTILYEREHGFAHRKAKRRPQQSAKENIILKVRTESFDNADLYSSGGLPAVET